ncbi:MTHFSD isoform 16, partial [Pan troglodytes]
PRAVGVSKQDIREQIWGYMESQNLADFPRPVHHRIPNFKGASHAAEQLPRLQAFKTARTIKVNPDAPQKSARFFVLESKKTLLVPTPRLRTGLFNKITPPPGATKDILRKCATSQVPPERLGRQDRISKTCSIGNCLTSSNCSVPAPVDPVR